MELFFKTVGCGLTAVILCLCLSGTAKEYGVFITVLGCALIGVGALWYLEPILDYLSVLQQQIPLDHTILETMVKTAGIALIGDLAGAISSDSGNASLGKMLQLLTSVMILWLSLPLLQALLELLTNLLEAL